MKILLPTTMPLDPQLPSDVEVVYLDCRQPIPDEHRDAKVLVVWGASRAHLHSATQLENLRLVQSLSAGVDAIQAAGFADDVLIATGAGLHSYPVTEHTLALLLSLIRRLPEMAHSQRLHEWNRELGGIQPLHPDGKITTLLGASVVVWGFGEIGQHMAPVLQALGARVTGVARSAGERAGFPVITADELPALLPTTDVLISILPASEDTRRVVNGEIFAALPPHAFVVNVGRGAVLDQDALIGALTSGSIAGAALDVTDPEPLPADHSLWDAPHLVISPHAASGRPVGADERIARNVLALREGTEILHLA